MKPLKFLIVVIALGLSAAPLARAQDQADPSTPPATGRQGKGGQRGGRGQAMNADARVAQLDKALKLTDDQKAKIKDIYAKAQQDMQATRGTGSGGDQKANREKMQQAMKATHDEVRALLTDEQQKKFDAMPQAGAGGQKGGKRKK